MIHSHSAAKPAANGSRAETNGSHGSAVAHAGADASIFRKFFTAEPFVDRLTTQPDEGVDVLIPVMHTNELWHSNLTSIYREIPVKRLLLGDGGCIDHTLDIARKFPRVEVHDHRSFVSLGYSIRKLIEAVQTEWFIYLHSDVYLPPGWFEVMKKYQGTYDWYECRQQLAVLLDFPLEYDNSPRAYSGSQMGRTSAFRSVLPKIDDDYLYRNEDIILAALVQQAGFRYGRVDDTFHYHQHMVKKSKWERKVTVSFSVDAAPDEKVRAQMMQAKGLVKYLEPTPNLVEQVEINVRGLLDAGAISRRDFKAWVERTNPRWWSRMPLRVRLSRVKARLLDVVRLSVAWLRAAAALARALFRVVCW